MGTLYFLSPEMKVNCALLSLAGVVFGDDYHADLKKSNTKRYDSRYEEKTSEYWQKISKNDIYDSLKKKRIEKRAKNVILFIGDGMGFPTTTAGRILIGGEEYVSSVDQMPFSGSIKTYNVDYQTPDSAGTATAYLTGVKGNYYTTGVNTHVQVKDCDAIKGNEVESVLMKAKRAGKGTGIVTTTRINHASPSGAYAHSAYRKWYDHTNIDEQEDMTNEEKKSCVDLAKQFVEQQKYIDVALGGGYKHFCKKSTTEDGKCYREQFRNDNNIDYMESRDELLSLIRAGTEKSIVGMFAEKEMAYETEKLNDPELLAKEPSLSEMTKLALTRLEQEENGYYLFVEGGRIDHGHHANQPVRALYEFVEFEKTINQTMEVIDPEETLVLISADHSHQFTMGGYGIRASNVFGLGSHEAYPVMWPADLGDGIASTDKENVFIIDYADGPGFKLKDTSLEDETNNPAGKKCGRVPPSDTEEKRSPDNIMKNEGEMGLFPGTAYLDYSSHGGEDVAVQGIGPFAHLVTGNHEQTFVAHLTEFALCIGDYQNENHCLVDSSQSALIGGFLVILLAMQ